MAMVGTAAQWAADESVPLLEETVGQLLRRQAAARPEAPALVGVAHGSGAERRHTYAGLLHEALGVAARLQELAAPGELVALWAPNVVEWPIIEYGAALAGVVLVALNPVLRDHELRYALRHSGAAVLLHAERSRDHDLAAVAAAVTADCPDLRTVVSLADRAGWTGDGAAFRPPEGLTPDSPAMLQYTSGTTGAPKGVLLRHRSLVNVAHLTMLAAGVPAGSVALDPLPMFHTAACVIGTLGPLAVGGAVVLVDRFVPGPVLEQLAREHVEVLFYVPTVLGALIDEAAASPGPAPRLHTVMGGAANVPATMIEAAEERFGATVINLFGQTELAPVLTATRPGSSRRDLLTTVGHPLPQVDCKIVDPATGATRALGEVGEICARGYQQLVAYLHDPEATARTVDADGWVHTGDLGSMDHRGVVTLTGRLKDLIIRGGDNIAPAEIESCLVEHPAVASAAVVGLPDGRWGEVVAAVVTLRRPALAGVADGASPALPSPDQASLGAVHPTVGPTVGALEEHCRARLAPFKRPERWFVADELPVTPTGKVQKYRLVEAIVAAGDPGDPGDPGSGSTVARDGSDRSNLTEIRRSSPS